MTTITIRTNDTYGMRLFRRLKADKNLTAVTKENASAKKKFDEIELVMPGTALTDEELLQVLSRASKGRSISLHAARKRTLTKIAAWRKRK